MDPTLSAEERATYTKQWQERVLFQEGVDPDDEYIWEGVAVGFYIGLGLSVQDAHVLARSWQDGYHENQKG